MRTLEFTVTVKVDDDIVDFDVVEKDVQDVMNNAISLRKIEGATEALVELTDVDFSG